ncbi:hypothetical protein NDU88_007207 [Pleurodeles waltl]|uniref:Uncharacterized protein n=1 Tax=Pleurodeles waltl TaxID=8319 RepID=A0AAV7NUA4_PLEWA|nr:hypothetical protein NDU88_007207 [Pleurodeles waltl]
MSDPEYRGQRRGLCSGGRSAGAQGGTLGGAGAAAPLCCCFVAVPGAPLLLAGSSGAALASPDPGSPALGPARPHTVRSGAARYQRERPWALLG